MDGSTPSFPIYNHLLELAHTHAHWVGDSIEIFHPLSSPFPPELYLSKCQGIFQWVGSMHPRIGASALASVLPMNIQGWFHLGLTGLISLLSKGFSRVFSNTTVRKHKFFDAQPSLWSIVTSVHNSWKKHGFDYTDLCQQSDISALSRFVVAFLPRSKCPGCSHCPQWFWSPRKWNLPLYGSY